MSMWGDDDIILYTPCWVGQHILYIVIAIRWFIRHKIAEGPCPWFMHLLQNSLLQQTHQLVHPPCHHEHIPANRKGGQTSTTFQAFFHIFIGFGNMHKSNIWCSLYNILFIIVHFEVHSFDDCRFVKEFFWFMSCMIWKQ